MHPKKSRGEFSFGTAPPWMLSFGDMMTQIVVFFALVISFSTIGLGKFRAAMESFRGAVSFFPATGGMTLMAPPAPGEAEAAMEAAAAIEQAVEQANLAKYIEVYEGGGGIRVIFANQALFDEGRDELKPAMEPVLAKVVETARRLKVSEVRIEGHTDDTPIHTDRFPSNWELSAGRAMRVLKYFQSKGFPPGKLIAVGYGEYRPRVQVPRSATADEKSPNRRVEVFLKLRGGANQTPGAPEPSAAPDRWEE